MYVYVCIYVIAYFIWQADKFLGGLFFTCLSIHSSTFEAFFSSVLFTQAYIWDIFYVFFIPSEVRKIVMLKISGIYARVKIITKKVENLEKCWKKQKKNIPTKNSSVCQMTKFNEAGEYFLICPDKLKNRWIWQEITKMMGTNVRV